MFAKFKEIKILAHIRGKLELLQLKILITKIKNSINKRSMQNTAEKNYLTGR